MEQVTNRNSQKDATRWTRQKWSHSHPSAKKAKKNRQKELSRNKTTRFEDPLSLNKTLTKSYLGSSTFNPSQNTEKQKIDSIYPISLLRKDSTTSAQRKLAAIIPLYHMKAEFHNNSEGFYVPETELNHMLQYHKSPTRLI